LGRLGDTSAESASEPEWGGGHPLEAELESEEGYQYETPARKPIEIGPVVICGGKPFAVLDAFRFNVSALRRDGVRDHPAQILVVAREILRRRATGNPVLSVCIVGHTDFFGSVDYNYLLGLRRARAVKDALCRVLGGRAGPITFVVNSMGKTDPVTKDTTPAARARNRRVDIHLIMSERLKGERCFRYVPPDSAGCGVPPPRRRRESAFEIEERGYQREYEVTKIRVRPNLSLFLDSTNTSHRNHFQHQATVTARRIAAIGSPDAADCKPRVGATSYQTGADIVAAIRAAWQCAGKKPLQQVHIFGHSGSYGIFGATSGTAGLYQNSSDPGPTARTAGARTIADIPTDILSDNVIFVLHGCNQAYGCNVKGDDDNFAQSLLEHLAGSLKNPRVFGHYNTGCAGRNNSWCEYSTTRARGRAGSGPSGYTEPGGCG
jgi:hypothetical protein